MNSAATYAPAGRVKGLVREQAVVTRTKRPMTQGQTERELVLRAIKRDEAAFAKLYDLFVDKIYRYIYYRTGSQTEAEDLTAQVFLKSWQAIEGYKWTDRPFAAWLYRIAHNAMVDHFRTHHDATPLEEIVHVEDRGSSLEDIVQGKLAGEDIRRALGRLTPDQQQVILLRFLEGYSTPEVAAIMGKQPGAIRTLQHRALGALRTVFARGKQQF